MIEKIKKWLAKDLIGVDEIAKALQVGTNDVMSYRRYHSLPIKRNDNSVWQIGKRELKEWSKDYSNVLAKTRRDLCLFYDQAAKVKKPTFQKEKRW